MKTPFVFSLLLLCLANSYAQDKSKITQKPFSKSSNSIQLNAGSAGAGLDFRTGIASRLSARAGFSAIPSITFNSNGGKYEDVISGHSFNGHVLLDYTPFKHHLKNFRVVTGAAYFNTKGTVKRSTKEGDFNYGDIPLSKEEVGYVTAETVYKGVAPYAGIGVFNIFGASRVNVNFDFGTYYLPAPKVDLSGTGMLAGMSSEKDQLQENISGYRWLPVVQLNLIYKL